MFGRRLIAMVAVAALVGGAACSAEPEVEDNVRVEEGAEDDADNMADPGSEDVSDIEDAGDDESTEEESTIQEDDVQPGGAGD